MSLELLFGQLIIGLINGSFLALMSLGLAIIFGLLNIVNFAHGAIYMLGAFTALLLLNWFGVSYWLALLLVPIIVGALGVVAERLLIRHVYKLEHLFGMLLTFGVALVLEGLFRREFGSIGQPYPNPMRGGIDLGILFLPHYRAWVPLVSIVTCLGVWLLIERTKLGSVLRAATERPDIVQSLGINVPVVVTLTYGFGAALAGFAGVLAAPIYSVNPLMGSGIIVTVFAVVVIGGMGSTLGAIVSGYLVGLVQAVTNIVYPQASEVSIFLLMTIVLIIRPYGLFGVRS